MTKIIKVRREGQKPSQVIIGEALERLEDLLPKEGRVIVVTDANIDRIYGRILESYDRIVIGMGESHKQLRTIEQVYKQLIDKGADRHSYILGVGGGIVTDMAGFVASTYMRGVGFGFIATTLLAQVDASVGGKNGVNVEGYKNMIGTFNQPDFVLCDLSMLKTLSDKEFRSGMAEIIKVGVIADPKLFEMFEKHTYEKLREDEKVLQQLIYRAVKVKAEVVEADERELGERKKLNLGHTFGHAIEKLSTSYVHGEAIAIGMTMACHVAETLGVLSAEESLRIVGVLQKMGLPTVCDIEPKRLLKAMEKDKKRNAETVDLILPQSVGSCLIRTTSFTELQKILCE